MRGRDRGHLNKALEHLGEALQACRDTLVRKNGSLHPRTLECILNLAELKVKMGDLAGAEQLRQEYNDHIEPRAGRQPNPAVVARAA